MSTPKKITVNQEFLEEKQVIAEEVVRAKMQYTQVYWPEWNDAELNAISWDEGKQFSSSRITNLGGDFFEDPDPADLPVSINGELRSWKRPHEVFFDSKLTLYNQTNFELWVPSILARFSFYRYFSEVLPLMQYYAVRYGIPVESETPTFVPTTQGEPWKPWHHIYSYCKAGKGQVHKPMYSPYGKYVVRLFYLGAWRMFVVDDRIPCDMNDECMLPCTKTPGELWPIILTKALFKIISLTPTMNFNLNDFSLISALTGWVSIKLTTSNKSEEEIWRRLCVLLPYYVIQRKMSTIKPPTPAKEKHSSLKGSAKEMEKASEQKVEHFCFLTASIEHHRESQPVSRTHTVVLTLVRDIPLKEAHKREKTKLWKRLRWIYWALEKGIWMDEKSLPPYRRVNYITLMKDLSRYLEPDPKQEVTMFEYANDENIDSMLESTPVKSHYKEDREKEDWCDFYKLYKFVTDINVFLKPHYFRTIFKISCLTNEGSEPKKSLESSKSTKTTAKMSTLPPNFYFYVPAPKKFGNEPGYLFCESSSEIFLCICLSVSPEGIKRFAGYLEAGQPEFLKVGHASLLLEVFDWKTLAQGEVVGFLKTVGTSSTYLSLKPGRHIFKVWIYSDSAYIANIYSNVEVGVYDGPKIRFLMGLEAGIILEYINEVADGFLALVQKFGKPDLSSALHEFYRSILPKKTSRLQRKTSPDAFIEAFLNAIVLSLRNLIAHNEEVKLMVGALRSLFVNLNIENPPLLMALGSYTDGIKRGGNPRRSLAGKDKSFVEGFVYQWTVEQISKIIIIQKIFRGYRVRLLLKHQQPSRKEFKAYTDRLKKICDVVFVPNKREVEVGRIIRNVVIGNPNLTEDFTFHKDLFKTIQVEEFTGKISNVEPHTWVPVTRFIVASHAKEPVPCAFYFSCDLEEYVLLAVDNDTNKELFRLSNCVSPYYYYNNAKGYTIFAFGWNKASVRNVNWRIEMVRMKHFQVLHLCNTLLNFQCYPYNIPSTELFELKNHYVPNHKFRICRFLIKVNKPTLLTLRLSTSYSDVSFRLSVELDKKFCPLVSESSEITSKVIAKTGSLNGAVLLPSVFLECFEPNHWYGESVEEGEPTLYIVEAVVLNNSWPLTKQEWGVVEPLRVNGSNGRESAFNIQKRTDSRKRLPKSAKSRSLETKPLENPYWLLQVLHDSTDTHDSVESFTVEEDKSAIEAIKAMKISWEEKDPGRRKRGRELRMRFLNSILSEDQLLKNNLKELLDGEEKTDDDTSNKYRSIISIFNNFSYLTESTSPRRYSKSPRILPKMPTQELLKKYSKIVKQKVYSDAEHLMSGFGSDLEEEDVYCEKLSKYLPNKTSEDRKKFLAKASYYREVLEKYINDQRALSALLMEQAYEGRQKAVDRLIK